MIQWFKDLYNKWFGEKPVPVDPVQHKLDTIAKHNRENAIRDRYPHMNRKLTDNR